MLLKCSDLELVPIKQSEAAEFVRTHHRHHLPSAGWLWGHGLVNAFGVLVGVAIVGRPVARALDDGLTCEVTRLCTNGAINAASKLYGATRRAAQAKGYRRGITYIRADETGGSLRASGWYYLYDVKGRSWSNPNRPRTDKTEIIDRIAYGWGKWPKLLENRLAQ